MCSLCQGQAKEAAVSSNIFEQIIAPFNSMMSIPLESGGLLGDEWRPQGVLALQVIQMPFPHASLCYAQMPSISNQPS